MSIQPAPIDPVPDATIQVAHAAFPKGNPYLTLRDQLGVIFQDDDFIDLYPATGQPSLSPWRLAWVTILQFRETLSDRQAAEAVRAALSQIWVYRCAGPYHPRSVGRLRGQFDELFGHGETFQLFTVELPFAQHSH